MLPLTTTTVDVDRPTPNADPDEPGTLLRLYTGLSGHVGSPNGDSLVANGHQELVDAVLYVDLTDPPLSASDVITDLTTGDTYRVTWARRRQGIGLDHQAAGLRSVIGAALG